MKNQIRCFLIFNLLAIFVFTPNHCVFAQANPSLEVAVKNFLGTLNAEELKQTSYVLGDTLRKKWSNLPVGIMPRPGIRYGALSDKSRLAYHRVLTAIFSSQGYLKTTSIMSLDDILNQLFQEDFDKGAIDEKMLKMTQNMNWAHGNYFISVWGTPQSKEPWGLDFGGHHLALNITVKDKTVIASPFFYGTDPSEVKTSKYAGLRILSKEEDYGFMLINMLTEGQKKKAILPQTVPGDILTNPNSSQRITSYYGISAKEFNEDQQVMLRILIEEYIHNFEHDTAHRLFEKLQKTGLDKVYFAWIGSLDNNKPHYYLINAPDFLIEYDNVGFQNDGNHIHAILREKGNDFGEDLLKKHYLAEKH